MVGDEACRTGDKACLIGDNGCLIGDKTCFIGYIVRLKVYFFIALKELRQPEILPQKANKCYVLPLTCNPYYSCGCLNPFTKTAQSRSKHLSV